MGADSTNLVDPSLKLLTIGIPGDPSFPINTYNAMQQLAVAEFGGNPSYDEFMSSWNAVGHRFHGSVSLSHSLIISLGPPSTTGTVEARHKEDQELFYFFCSCLSALECIYYSAYALGHMTTGLFDFDNPKTRKKVSPRFCVETFNRLLPQSLLTAKLGDSISKMDGTTNTFVELEQIRNTLSHRSQPGRTFGWAGPDDPTTKWHQFQIELNGGLIAKHRDFLGSTASLLIDEMYRFLIGSLALAREPL